MTKLKWTRAQKRAAKHTAAQLAVKKPRVDEQITMQAFVDENRIGCFKCRKHDGVIWHGTGRQKSGRPWALCTGCTSR